MTYQDIQDYADEIASARLGFGVVDEVWSDIKRLFNPSIGEMLAINLMANAIIASDSGVDIDWDDVTEKCQSYL